MNEQPTLSRAQACLILGVGRHASPDEVRAAYRRVMQAVHPDRNSAEEAHRLALMANAAREVLDRPVDADGNLVPTESHDDSSNRDERDDSSDWEEPSDRYTAAPPRSDPAQEASRESTDQRPRTDGTHRRASPEGRRRSLTTVLVRWLAAVIGMGLILPTGLGYIGMVFGGLAGNWPWFGVCVLISVSGSVSAGLIWHHFHVDDDFMRKPIVAVPGVACGFVLLILLFGSLEGCPSLS